MKNNLLLILLVFIVSMEVSAQYQSISVDAVYIVVYENSSVFSYGNPEYIAEIDQMIGSDSGEVQKLFKLGNPSDIPSGIYKIRLEDLKNDLYRVIGTDYVLKMRYSSISTFNSYILKASGYSIILEEVKTY